MKRILVFLKMTTVFSVFAGLLSACPVSKSRQVGGCQYGSISPQKGLLTIQSIKPVQSGKDTIYLVEVKGVFDRTFRMKARAFKSCLESKGLGVGAKVHGVIQPGGPCPPMYRIKECMGAPGK